MMPVGPLMIEHRLIERMIFIFDQHVKTAASPKLIDLSIIEKGIDFMRSYADRCHHGKEEDILFVALNAKTLTAEEKRIFNELIEEHAVARAAVKSLDMAREQAEKGSAEAFDDIIRIVGKIAVLYPAHIEKEDKRFFVPIMRYFTQDEQDDMLRQFDEFDRLLIHEKYRKIVENLEAGIKPAEAISISKSANAAVYECTVCGYEYNPERGDSKHGIPSGTSFESLPDDWVCPLCGATKNLFVKQVD